MSGSIILLSGPPGSGKTTVAKALVASSLARACVNIEGDTFWFFKVKGRPPRPELFQIIMQAMFNSAEAYARAGYEAVLDFSVPPWFLPALRQEQPEAEVHFVALCPSEAVCARRAAEREEGRMPDYGPYHDIYEDFAKAAEIAKHLIREDAMSAEDLAAKIRAGLSAGAYRLA